MKPADDAEALGLNGTIGGAAGLLNAAIRSLKDPPLGFSPAAGKGGFDGCFCAVSLAACGAEDCVGFGCGSPEEGGITGTCMTGARRDSPTLVTAGPFSDSCSTLSSGLPLAASTGASTVGIASGSFLDLLGLEGRGGAGGSYFSTKFLGKMPSLIPDSPM